MDGERRGGILKAFYVSSRVLAHSLVGIGFSPLLSGFSHVVMTQNFPMMENRNTLNGPSSLIHTHTTKHYAFKTRAVGCLFMLEHTIGSVQKRARRR